MPETTVPKPLFTERARVGDIKVDHTYQRPFSEAWISQFFPQRGNPARKQFDLRAVAVPSISLRDTGELFALDGQHRVKLVERMLGADHQLLVAVYADLTIEEEAEYCLLLNQDRPQRPADRYRIALAAQETLATSVQSELRRLGYYAEGDDSGTRQGLTVLRSTAGLLKMMQSAKAPGFRRIVRIVKDAWPDDPGATDWRVWGGVWALMSHYHPDVDFDGRLIDKLKTHASVYYIQQAPVASGGNSFAVSVARVMARVYNTRQSPKHRLPEWDAVSGVRGPQNTNQESDDNG